MDRADIRRKLAIAMVAFSAIGVISYFLPFVDFLISFSYITIYRGSGFGNYIPVILSAAGLVCSVLVLCGKEKLEYAAGIAELAAFVMIFILMNDDSYIITASDFSGAGYVLFIIAHIVAVVACAAYVAIEYSGRGKFIKPKDEAKVCPNCGEIISGSAIFCPLCGNSTRKSVKKCRFCESILDEGTAFCPVCGKPVKDDLKYVKKYCPKCGTELPAGISTCPVCNDKKSGSLGNGWYVSDDLG